MEIDQAPIDVPANAAASAPAETQAKKFSPPLDGVTQDLIPEAVAYLRLLLVLMNLDAGKVQEVSSAAVHYLCWCAIKN